MRLKLKFIVWFMEKNARGHQKRWDYKRTGLFPAIACLALGRPTADLLRFLFPFVCIYPPLLQAECKTGSFIDD